MDYVSPWEGLLEAVRHVMAATMVSEEGAKALIRSALADRQVKFQAKLGRHASNGLRAADTILEGKDFNIPSEIGSADLNWEQSCPLRPWVVRRGGSEVPGQWFLKWIKLCRADVTDVCAGAFPEPAPPTPSWRTEAVGTTRDNRAAAFPTSAAAPEDLNAAGSIRRRGPRPRKSEQTKAAMKADIQQGRFSVAELRDMLEKNLVTTYGVSRDTARKAREAVLSELAED